MLNPMPSQSFLKFETKMLKDVDRLLASHASLNHSGGGRRGLGHITRSGVFTLCAAWELFVEELVIEIALCIVDRAANANDLPLQVRKELAKTVREHKHELKPLELAGDGWKNVYTSHVNAVVSGLNTPKANPINEMYNSLVGWKMPSDTWSRGNAYIDDFVRVRGDIAHRGSGAAYVRIGDLRDDYRVGVPATALELDNAACDYLNEVTVGARPWNRRL